MVMVAGAHQAALVVQVYDGPWHQSVAPKPVPACCSYTFLGGTLCGIEACHKEAWPTTQLALVAIATGSAPEHTCPALCRWTHEELSWLPRRERDKRRILKDGWFRTKWSGWAPGGRA
jgi:hypothetical protein